MTTATPGLRRVATACRICAVGCGTIVDLDGDEVVRITGDPDDPWSHGYTCSKGRAGPAFHRDPLRLDVPQVRRGGELVSTSWDDALDDIAATISGIVDAHGPGAVASYTGTAGDRTARSRRSYPSDVGSVASPCTPTEVWWSPAATSATCATARRGSCSPPTPPG
jgi:anaerobic selenocysteine-containing dehydrogenase